MGLLRVPVKFEDLKPGQHVFILVKSWFKAKRYWPSEIVSGTIREVGEKVIVINGRVGNQDFSRLSIPKSGIAEVWAVTIIPARE